MTTYRRIAFASLVSLVIGILIILFYFAYVDLETLRSNKAFWRGDELDWTVFGVTMVVLGGLAWIAMLLYARPLQRWEQSRRTGKDVPPTDIQRRAAIYPQILALIGLSMATLAGLFFAQGGIMFMTTDAPTFWRTFLGVAVVGGSTLAMLIFLVSERAWRPHLPNFFPIGSASAIQNARFPVGVRLSVTLLLTGLVPLLVLGAVARTTAVDIAAAPEEVPYVLERLQRTYLFIVGVAVFSNLLLSSLTVQSLLAPLQQLTSAMERVSEGDLRTQVPVTSNDELNDLATSFNQMVVQVEQGQRMRDLFGRYVSHEVAEEVLAKGSALGGEQVVATMLFADIRGFTSLSERLTAPQVVELLNRYFTRMVNAVAEEGGLVNKFGGDSLLAIFGAPIRNADHARRAVRAATHMLHEMTAFNAEQRERGLPELQIGVGVASGEVVAGNIGGEERLEYTVIGDPVNLASRLQSLTKELGHPLLISAETQRLLNGEFHMLTAVGELEVRGKQHPVPVFTPARAMVQSR